MGCQPGHILFVDPRQALGAVTALQANPTSPPTIDRYQRDALGSRISTIAVAINETLRPKNLTETSMLHLRQETALSQVHGPLSASFWSIEAAEKDIDRTAGKIDVVLTGVQRVRENARYDIFGKPGEENKVENALSLSTKDMNTLLGSLSFWKMVWRVDEIGALVSTAVQGQWCKGLESQVRDAWVELMGRISSSSSKPAHSTNRAAGMYPEGTVQLCIQSSLCCPPSFACSRKPTSTVDAFTYV